MNWTDERVEIMRKLWSEGLSASQIANQLGGTSRNAVIGKLHRLKLSGRSGTTATPARRKKKAQALSVSKSVSLAVSALRHVSTSIDADVLRAQFDVEPVVRYHIRPTENVVVPISQHLQLVELTQRTCKWPNGDPLSEDFNFCGNDAVEGRLGTTNTDIPYCKYHCRLAYQPAYERRRAR
jgi:GcrA cell cycle regulator